MRSPLVAGLLGAGLILAFGHGTAAASEPTWLAIEVPTSVALGVHPMVILRLTSRTTPLGGQQVEVRVDGRVTLRLLTGPDGRASAVVARDLESGEHVVEGVFAGTSRFRPAASQLVRLTVQPAELTVSTVPAVAGIPLVSVDGGEPLITDADGFVRLVVRKVGRVELRVNPQIDTPDRRIRFVRWSDRPDAVLERTLRVPLVRPIVVGLELSYPVTLRFHAPDGSTVDPSAIDIVDIRNGRGESIGMIAPGPQWLPANRITRPASGLTSEPLEYIVDSVAVRGQQVVNRGQQRFRADDPATWEIELLLYVLDVRAEDALLGIPSSATVRLVRPDGTEEHLPLGAAGRARIRGLPRGDYQVSIVGGLGLALVTPVALSRDQEARVILVSVLDVALVAGLTCGGALGLLIIGRPAIIRSGWKRLGSRVAAPRSR